MAQPTLEDLTAGLDAACVAALGDTIQFKPAGGAYATIKSFVEFSDRVRDLETGRVVEQDITVEVFDADVAERPTGNDRVRIAAKPGETFRPINAARNRSGSGWVFEVVKVSA